jgi:hypothetical protein
MTIGFLTAVPMQVYYGTDYVRQAQRRERQTNMSLNAIHGSLSNTALIYFAILAIWGLVRFARRQGVSSNYWGALVIGELLILAQGTLGAFLWYSGLRPGRGIHILYGLVSALSIPAVYVYTKGGEERRDMLIYAAVALVTVGLILRAMTTAG